MRFIGIWAISSVVFVSLLLAVCCGKLDAFNHWMFHSYLGGLLFMAGLAVWVIGSLCTVAGWFRRQ